MIISDILNIVTEKTDPCFSFSDSKGTNGITIFNVRAENLPPDCDGNKKMTFRTDNGDTYSVWSPLHCFKRSLYPNWRGDFSFDTRANEGIPLMQFIDKKGNNICLFAILDFTSDLHLRGGIDERSGKIEIDVTVKSIKNGYGSVIYCDKRNVAYYDAIGDYNAFLREQGYSTAFVPDSARRRTYSSWYAFQKSITQDKLYEQCLLAKEYGMNTVIIDDGWQTPVNSQYENAYITAGDWEPYTPKFPDMKGLVSDLHKQNIKVILWIATPFIGSESKHFDFFNGRFLCRNRDDGTVMVADPRYADIRKWYVDFLTDRMKRWNLDGFKLDFIDSFRLSDESNTDYDNMDHPNLGDAVTVLLEEITSALKNINPNVMIEYRQQYIGPAMQKTGNLLRVDDCAYGAMYNRINGIDLRLTAPCSAIHSDMLMWDYEASAEGAADQLSALLFIVPQISMFFDKLTEEHRKVLKFYLDFIDDNIDVLQFGKLVPLNPEAFYPVIYAQKDGTVVSALYSANSFKVPDSTEKLIVVNASGNPVVYLDCGNNSFVGRNYVIKNCMGDFVCGGTVNSTLESFEIPHNGIMFVL